MFSALRRRSAREEGAVLVLLMLLMVSLLGVAGLVLDFGLVRADRQQNKSAADLAVAAGMRQLELSGYPAPFRGVCEAVKFLKANQPELAAMTGTYRKGDDTATSSSDPCSPAAPEWYQLCVPNTESSWAWYQGSAAGGRLVVDVKSGYRLSDGGFRDEDLISGDSGDSAMGDCDHLAVIVSETQQPGFGKVVFGGTLSSKARSVGRITQSIDVTAVIALLLLEHVDCNVLTFDGTNSLVRVKGYDIQPGIIHADSIGSTSLGGENCNNQILNAREASTGSPLNYTGPSARAERAEVPVNAGDHPESGHVSVAALTGLPGADPSKASTPCPETVYAEPGDPSQPSRCVEGSSRKGRINVDVLFRERIADLREQAATRVKWNQPQADGWGLGQPDSAGNYAYFSSCPTGTVGERYVFINSSCNNTDVTFTHDEAEIIITGGISGGNVTFTSPASVYVGNGVSESGSSTVSVNAGLAAHCTARGNDSQPGGDRSQTSKFVVVNGTFKATGGLVRMCGTMLLLGDGSNSGPCDPHPAIPDRDGVAPYDNCFKGNIDIAGGAVLDWTAPNATDSRMIWTDSAAQPYLDQFEDLAFWTETQKGNKISGGGSNVIKGVFFLPNADPFAISGGAAQDIDRDAQFIIRKLNMTGNGLLSLRPNPQSAISFPYFSGFTMVR